MREIDHKKLLSDKKKQRSGRSSPESSVFSGSSYKLNSPKKKSEYDKLFEGETSEYDNVDFSKEYSKTVKSKHSKASDTLLSLSNDDDYVYDEYENAYKGISSDLDDIDFDKEYRGPNVKEKSDREDKSENVWNSGDDYALPDGDSHISMILAKPKPQIPVIQAKEHPAQDNAGQTDRTLAVAEDFVRRWKIITVGDAIYIYNGQFYSFLSEKELQRLILNNYRNEIGRASPATVLRNVAYLIRICTDKEYEEFPVNPHIIVFENGTLEVETGQFRNNSPEDLSSSALGIDYDPECWEMPHIQRFLKTVAGGDIDLYERIMQVIGYILSNDNKAKSFFYLEGVGDAGKSRFCDLIASFFPTSGANKVARIALQDLDGKFALSNLVNAKLNISEDLPDSPLSPKTVSKIKMISDSNRLEAEAKYVQAFSFKPQCKLLFASNHPLRLKEYDAAFVNRVVYIPFFNAIPKHKQDPMILDKMQRELPALFNHAFAAYRRFVANGYVWAGADKFKPDICVVSSGLSYDKEQILERFVDTCCIVEKDVVTPTADLRYAYERFCQKNRYSPVMGDRFSRELKNVLPSTVTRIKIGNQQRGFKGIKLKDGIDISIY